MAVVDVFRRRLQVKVISLIVVILVLGFGVLVILNIQRERGALIHQNRETSRLLASTIVGSIENGMLEGRPDIIRMLIHNLKAELTDVRQLDVFRGNGVEAFSDLKTAMAVNRLYGLESSVMKRLKTMERPPGQTISHPLFTRAAATMQPQEHYEMVDGARSLTLFYPLRNRPVCQGCHGADHKVRGIVRLSLSLDKLEGELAANRNRQIGVALLTILGAMASLVVLMRKVVLTPMRTVMETAQRVGGGDFDARVSVRTQDEIGQLGTAINEMTGRLKGAYDDLAAKNVELNEALRNLQESARKVELLEQIKGELAKFVPESVSRLLEQDPNARELEKREVDVSVLFLDVEGYTQLSEQLAPQRLNRLIQDYFSSFLEIIRAQGGDVNETAGDGLMVIFQSEGSPTRHALNATGAAVQIEARLADLNREFVGVYPRVSIHVGINSGQAFIGATKLDVTGGGRWTFTASGTTTNLAARIAGLARGGDIMVGPETAERIKQHYVLESTGEHHLKNVSAPVRAFRLVLPGVYSKVLA
ncbi:MAG: adenylate/guanylate cyclase domain-containing protein [Candidatus Methylomirabilia bacterium]